MMVVGLKVVGDLSLLRPLLFSWRLLPLSWKFHNQAVLVVGFSRITLSRPPISNFTVVLTSPSSQPISLSSLWRKKLNPAPLCILRHRCLRVARRAVKTGNVFNSDNVQAEKGMPEDIKQPDGTLEGVLGSVDQACRPFGIQCLVAIPDGSGLKVETTADDVCLGPACSVVEELKDHGSDV